MLCVHHRGPDTDDGTTAILTGVPMIRRVLVVAAVIGTSRGLYGLLNEPASRGAGPAAAVLVVSVLIAGVGSAPPVRALPALVVVLVVAVTALAAALISLCTATTGLAAGLSTGFGLVLLVAAVQAGAALSRARRRARRARRARQRN